MPAEPKGMTVSLAKIEEAVDHLILSIGCGRILAGNEASLRKELFDYQLEALQTTIKVARKKLWRKIRDVRRERNAVQPISRLPNELLAAVLLEAIRYPYDGGGWEVPEYMQLAGYYRELNRYCQVHPLWRTVIEGTPEFWTILSTWHTDAQIDRALALSKACPLDVFTVNTPDDKLRDFLQRTLPHASRWRRLLAFEMKSNASFGLLEKVEVPRLEQITLQILRDFPLRKKLFVFSHGAAHLRTVSLTCIVVPYTAPWLRNLETLRIDLPRNTGYTPSRLLDMLRSNITLRHLALLNFDCITPLPDSGSVVLSYLEYLEVSTATSSDTGTILSTIKAPNCGELNIRWHSSMKQGSPAHSLQSWESIFESKLSGEVTLELGDTKLRDLLRLRTLLFTFTLTTNDIPECAHWVLSQFLPGRPSKVTHLTEVSDTQRLVPLISMLSRHLGDVSILEYTVDRAAILTTSPIRERLEEPQRTDRGTEWLLPNLRIIKNPYPRMRTDPAELVEKALTDGKAFIGKRWGKGAEVWASDGIKPPAVLEGVVFPPFDSIKHLIQLPNTHPSPEN